MEVDLLQHICSSSLEATGRNRSTQAHILRSISAFRLAVNTANNSYVDSGTLSLIWITAAFAGLLTPDDARVIPRTSPTLRRGSSFSQEYSSESTVGNKQAGVPFVFLSQARQVSYSLARKAVRTPGLGYASSSPPRRLISSRSALPK